MHMVPKVPINIWGIQSLLNDPAVQDIKVDCACGFLKSHTSFWGIEQKFRILCI